VTSKKYNHLSAFPVGLVLIAVGLSSSAAAVAGEVTVSDDGIPTVKVDYSGMDLSTSTGATLLYHQLKNASAQVCRSLEGRALSLQAQRRRCYNKALSKAVEEVNRPLLTALYQGQSPGFGPTVVAARAIRPPG
jgi:UrcA family protein